MPFIPHQQGLACITTGIFSAYIALCDISPWQIIVLEDTEEYIRMSDSREVQQQQRVPFPLLVSTSNEMRVAVGL